MRILRKDVHPTARFGQHIFFGDGPLHVGKDVVVNIGGFLDGSAAISIEDGVRIGPYVRILTGTHIYRKSVIRRSSLDPTIGLPVTIEKGCWVGMGVTILPGVKISRGCVIAAGALVVSTTEPNGLYAGVPAVRVKTLSIEDDCLGSD